MIEVVQAGQSGKTRLLFDMHRLRKRVFFDRMKWPVTVDKNGLEVDQFDIPEAIYLLALDKDRSVIGNWRLLPSTGPTMIRDIWPQFLESLPMPTDPFIWEASRFSVDSQSLDTRENLNQINIATAELFCGLTELCVLCGIQYIYTLYDDKIARLLRRLDCTPAALSQKFEIDGYMTQIGRFRTDQNMLECLKNKNKIDYDIIDQSDLPPYLQNLAMRNNHLHLREKESTYVCR